MTPNAPTRETDVLVIGAGPAGAAAGFWCATRGLDTVVLEKKHFPREKTCGDGLTPRAVKQLNDMGLGESLSQFHRYDGLRATAHGTALELHWPDGRESLVDDATLVNLPVLSDADLEQAYARIADFERELSTMRRGLHGVIDGIEAQLVTRQLPGS